MVYKVKSIILDKFIIKKKLPVPDILKIDVEGAEYEILKSINFKDIIINSILFESKHFDGTFFEGPKLKFIKEKLTKNGFETTQIDKENILATKRL